MTWGAVHTVNECVVDSCERHIGPDLIHSSILGVPELQSNLVLLFINQSINPHILPLSRLSRPVPASASRAADRRWRRTGREGAKASPTEGGETEVRSQMRTKWTSGSDLGWKGRTGGEEEEKRRQIGPPGGRDIDHLIIRFNKQSE